jgi:hypothetical protein
MSTAIYVVTSRGKDVYSAMTRISMASLRISNPGCKAVVVVDAASLVCMKQTRDPLLQEADEVLAFETPEGVDTFRNRFIKTNLRNLVDGQYLFLDSDMLIRGDISTLFDHETDIACAANHSKDLVEEQIWEEDSTTLSRLGWECRSDVYVNGGLMLCNDTDAARKFSADWHARWLHAHARIGGYRDQPALNSALRNTNIGLAVVPHRFNAQFKTAVRTAKDATIWHFYSGANEPPTTEFEALTARLVCGGSLANPAVEAIMRRPLPWLYRSWLDDWRAREIDRKGSFDEIDKAWFAGDRAQRRKQLLGRLRRKVRTSIDRISGIRRTKVPTRRA